jgi:hypothetical protein
LVYFPSLEASSILPYSKLNSPSPFCLCGLIAWLVDVPELYTLLQFGVCKPHTNNIALLRTRKQVLEMALVGLYPFTTA